MRMPPVTAKRLGYLERFSLLVVGNLEKFFYRWGYNVASHPWTVIFSAIVFSAACGIGLITFNMENRPEKLWIPWNSEFIRDTDWLKENSPSPFRFHFAIITADNILEPEALKFLNQVHNDVKELSSNGVKWNDVCFKVPVTKFTSRKRRRRQATNQTTSRPFDGFDDHFDFDESEESETQKEIPSKYYDPSFIISDSVYCTLLDSLEEECWENNLAELWSYNGKTINSLKKQDILNTINSETVSPIFGRPVNYTEDLGGIERNSTGHIIGAKSITLRWFARINRTALFVDGQSTNDLGTGQHVDLKNMKWEGKLSDMFQKKYSENSLPSGISFYFNLARSFGDISQATIMNDAGMLAVGFSIVFMYVVFMLGKFNMVEQRPWLSLAGLSCVGLAILVSYGICSAFKIIYGPVHNILPFLLLGIGIDDMFVIVQCWNNLSSFESKRSLQERMGLTLKHAGVSITVTSMTDVVAFAIGATTVLPALQSFCLYAALGIIATFIFQASFFVAWFTLDQKRLENNRNAFFPCCKKYIDYQPNECSKINFAKLGFDFMSKYLLSLPVKVLVLLVTFGVLGLNIYGNFKLRQEFNMIWFLPSDSYLFKYFDALKANYPGKGQDGFVVMYDIPFPENLASVESLINSLESSDVIFNVDSWYKYFKEYSNIHFNAGIPTANISQEDFQKYLGKFLFSPVGSKYRAQFKVDGNLTCGESAPEVEMSRIMFRFKAFPGPEEHIPAMREVKKIVKNGPFITTKKSKIFTWAFAFASWETDEIITVELYRNIAAAMVCVLITTVLLIANIRTCCMVLTCVLFTLVDVGGLMYFWGLTIDTVSCIDLVLAVGLCVDYASHIGHAFMTRIGTRDERAQQALAYIGPAVLNGGFSTFLAFILLVNSKSHVFMTFFKVFFLVVLFGLFHGLVFLPVILSILGPEPYPTAVMKQHKVEAAVELNPTRESSYVPSKPDKGPSNDTDRIAPNLVHDYVSSV